MVNEISGDSVKSAIALKLKNGFAVTTGSPPITTYPTIYKEQIVQKVVVPCFFIWVIDVSQWQVGKNKYKRDYQMNIRYHPTSNDPTSYEQLSRIGNMSLDVLKEIVLPSFTATSLGGRIVRGKNMDFKIIDNVLQIFVTYSFRGSFSELEYEDMKTLKQNSSITD